METTSRRNYLIAFFSVFILLWIFKLPNLYGGPPGAGLDDSWFIGLCWGMSRGLNFSHDIVFTFGPLGFLYNQELVTTELYRYSALFALATYTAFIAAIALIVYRVKPYSYLALLLALPFCLMLPSHDYMAIIVIAMFAFLLVQSNLRFPLLLTGSAILTVFTAFISLIKFTSLIAGICCLGCYALAYLVYFRFPVKKFLVLSCFIAAVYIISLGAMWLLLRQPLDGLPQYFINGYRIAADYTSAMSIDAFPANKSIIFLITGIISICSMVYLLADAFYRRNDRTAAFIIITLPLVCMVYKHGFVRYDNHAYIFFSVLYTVLLLLCIQLSGDDLHWRGKLKPLFNIGLAGIFTILSLAAAINILPWVISNNIFNSAGQLATARDVFCNSSTGASIISEDKIAIARQFSSRTGTAGLKELKNVVDNSSIDIYPWDISLLWAMDANWQPRPVFQSYQAYSPYLDDLNRQSLDDSPPQYLLYAYKSIDGRYPLFNEPATLRAIMNSYRPAGVYGEYVLLSRIDHKYTEKMDPLRTDKVIMGGTYTIPQKRGYVFARIYLHYSWLGNLKKMVHKPSHAYIQFIMSDGSTSQRYRIIPETLSNGVLLSSCISSNADLYNLLAGSSMNNVNSISITCSDPADYSSEIDIEYFTMNPSSPD